MEHKIRLITLSLAIGAGLAAKGHAQERFDGAYYGLSLNANRATAEAGKLDAEQDSRSLGAFIGTTRVKPGGLAWGGELSLNGFGGEGGVRDGGLRGKHKSGIVVSARARAGWASDTVFLYGTAGLGVSNGGLRDRGNSRDLTIAPVYGVGAEVALNESWSGRLELTRQNLSGREYDFGTGDKRVGQKIDTLSFGVARKF